MSVKRLFSYSIYRSLTKCRPFSTTIPRALASAKEPTKPKLARLDSIQSNTPYHFYQSKVLDEYISQPINASTLRDFIFFGRQMNTSRLLKSANWVHNELLVRLAHRIRDFQQLPFFVGKNTHIEFVYRLYWGAFETLRQFPTIKNQDDNVRFCQVLKSLLEDGLLVVPQLAQGLSESATYYAPDQNDLDLFLNRMLRSRISRRILAEQHLALTEACEDHFDNSMGFGDGYVGIIYVHCSAKELVERAKALVNQHVERYCHQTDISEDWKPPTIEVTLQQDHTTANNGRDEIVFAYVPEQLEHILYELLDNSMRYTMLRYPQGKYPPIKVTVSANESDVYFRVSDQGKGMDKERYECLWSYQSRARAGDFEDFKQVTTLPASIDGRASQASQMGHRHLGIGLTMSRIYAEYWGGELQILTMDGFGTDAYVRIPRLGTNIENLGIETHPVFQQSRPPLKRKKVSPKAKRSHELRLQSNPAAKKSHDLHHFDTSLTTAANSSNGWSQSHMIQS